MTPLVEGLRAFLHAQCDADALDEVAQEVFLRSLREQNARKALRAAGEPGRDAPKPPPPREPRAGEAGQMLELLGAAMDRLPPDFRRPLELRMAGSTLAQIAAATGRGLPETRTTLRRARHALLGLLDASVARRVRRAERLERAAGRNPLSERGARE